MSFRCTDCGEHHKKPTRVVKEIRPKTYPKRYRGKEIIDYGGTGWEIHLEGLVCGGCYKRRNS